MKFSERWATDYHFIGTREDPCSICRKQATHKVAEVVHAHRHPFTNYLCCSCFGDVMGSFARKTCDDNPV